MLVDRYTVRAGGISEEESVGNGINEGEIGLQYHAVFIYKTV